MRRLFYRTIVRTMTEDALLRVSLWCNSTGEPMNMEAAELIRRWGEQS
ncbi:hypothetical protein [Cupriavidus taiwanensis]|nr:hypothetical protein [Cupriavidus taiwanensis]SPA44651.1 hypothetical protein CBM2629_A150453 [Cupriavidus taiwanensis]